MSHFGSGVEYALHCLLYLVDEPSRQPSSRDLAEFQGVSASYVAKLFTQLEKAGIVVAAEGVRGGFRLARSAADISVLDVVDAIEGEKPLFDCRHVRANCVLFGGTPPGWAMSGVCAIHGVMLDAERRMRDALRVRTLAGLAGATRKKLPSDFHDGAAAWFSDRADRRVEPAGRKRRDSQEVDR